MADPRPRTVEFRGRPLALPAGATLLAGLAERGLPQFQRSVRYHRPRAPFCGVGHCSQCLVRVNGVPNVRACRYEPAPGDRITTENAWPSPRWDLLGALDLVFGRGLDSLHGFRRPVWAMPLYHRVIRRLAGYGAPPTADPAPIAPPREIRTDAIVVGAGPAGRAAAARIRAAGRATLLVDRSPVTAPPADVGLLAGVTAAFLPPPGRDGEFRLAATRGREGMILRAPRVLLAPGGYDANLLFPGNDRPGVMTAEGAMALRDRRGNPPFRRALLVGGGARAMEMVDRFGAHVEAVVAPTQVHGTIAERAAELDIPVFPRTLLTGAYGRSRVRSALLRRRGGGETTRLSVDAIVLAHRRLPHVPLFFQVGARMEWRGSTGAYYPVLDDALATSVPGLFTAGESAGFVAPASAEASGIAAAEALLDRPARLADLPPRTAGEGPHELEGYYRELLAGRTGRGKLVACACEDVLLGEIDAAHRAGYRGIEVIKRYTSLGTGLCQGRYCVPDALLLLAQLEGRPPSEVGFITQRPPVLPTPLDAWASLPDEADPEAGP